LVWSLISWRAEDEHLVGAVKNMDYYDYDSGGFPVATIFIAVIAIAFALLWLVAVMPSSPPPPPEKPKEPPRGTAPGLPYGVADAVRGELEVLQAQLSAFGYGNLDPLLGPAIHRVVNLVQDYERRVERMHEAARRTIEK